MGDKANWNGEKFTVPNQGVDANLTAMVSSNMEESDLTTEVPQ